MRNLFVLAGLCLCLTGEASATGIVITEVMADPEDEKSGEFVELYNAGEAPIDLEGWILGDSDDRNDTIKDFRGPDDIGLPGTKLAPGSYAIVVDPDYAGEYNERIAANGDTTRLLMLTIAGDSTLGNRGLGNSADRISIEKDNTEFDTFEWTKSAGGNGISWERKRIDEAAEDSNLIPSRHPDGSTPGFRNSTATDPPGMPNPDDPDDPDEPEEPVEPSEPEVPTQPTEPEEPAGPTEPEEPVEPSEPEEPAEPTDPEEPSMPPPGQAPAVEVFINEIMFDPGANRSEWIELYNHGSEAVDLSGWSLRLEHVERARLISGAALWLESRGYIVIADDITRFRQAYPAFDGRVLEATGGWAGLRNAGARLLLMDGNGIIIHDAEYDEEASPDPGRSAELVNPGFDPPIWGPSVAGMGGTPGQENSLYATHIPDGVSLHLSNNPFSPDGDNHEDVCLVTVDLPASYGVLHAMVFDVNGRFLKTLIDQTTVASRHVFAWDGTDQYGRRLPVGPYILYVEQLLPTLNRLTASKHLVVIAASL